MKKLLCCTALAAMIVLTSCGHGGTAGNGDSSAVNIDSMVNEAKANVDTTVQNAADTLNDSTDTTGSIK